MYIHVLFSLNVSLLEYQNQIKRKIKRLLLLYAYSWKNVLIPKSYCNGGVLILLGASWTADTYFYHTTLHISMDNNLASSVPTSLTIINRFIFFCIICFEGNFILLSSPHKWTRWIKTQESCQRTKPGFPCSGRSTQSTCHPFIQYLEQSGMLFAYEMFLLKPFLNHFKSFPL